MTNTPEEACLGCGKTESQVPLIPLQFEARKIHICPQCLPLLIHHPERIQEKIGRKS